MHRSPVSLEEAKTKRKLYDSKVFRQLLHYLMPYRLVFAVCLALVLATVVFDISLPYIVRVSIDRYIVPPHVKVTFSGKDTFFEDRVRREYHDDLVHLGEGVYLADLGRIDKEDRLLFEQGGYLSQERYLLRSVSDAQPAQREQLLSIAGKYPQIFHRRGDYFFASAEDLKGLTNRDIGVIREDDLSGIRVLALMFVLVLTLNFLCNFAYVYLLEYTGQRVMYDMRIQIFSHLLVLPLSFLQKNLVGRLVTRATNDVAAVNEMYTAVLVNGLKDIFLLGAIVFVMFRMNVRLTLFVLALTPVMVYISLVFRFKARDAYREMRQRLSKLNAFSQESISLIKIIQIFSRQKENFERFKKINQDNYTAAFRQLIISSIFRPLIEIVGSIAVALLIWYGGWEVITATFTFGSLVAFLSYIQMFFSPIRDLADKYDIFQGAIAASENIFDLMDQEVEDSGVGKKITRCEGRIEFQNVWFSYDGDEWVLKDVSFVVKPAQKIALVGRTGAGKTSIINLLFRFYEVNKGRILLDGVDIRDIERASLRSQMGLVLQDIFLFSGDIASNIRLANEDISEGRIQEALKYANATSFIEKLPGGCRAEVHERGANFSQGQRQLLAFARTLAFNRKILILDEATASVDSETETLIQSALERLLRNRTSLIIAHRLSTVKHVDTILVLHGGQIIERGTHEQLLKKRGQYYHLYKLQFQGLLSRP